MSRSPLANWLGFIRRHTNTMACTSPGDQMSLTQTLTHFPQNRPGTERADLRVLGHFRSKKARKVLRRSGWRNPPQLITRRSLVQVQPPQPQNRLISREIRRFFFTFDPKRFPEKLCGFAKFAVDPNCDPYGSKMHLGAALPRQGFPAVWDYFSAFRLPPSGPSLWSWPPPSGPPW